MAAPGVTRFGTGTPGSETAAGTTGYGHLSHDQEHPGDGASTEQQPPAKKKHRCSVQDPIQVVKEARIGKQLKTLCRVSSILETWMGTLSDRLNIKFGSLDSNAGVFGGAGGGEKDRWAAAKWDHKKDTYLQLKFGLRLEDFQFEFQAYQQLRAHFVDRPKYSAECLKKVWEVVESPMKLLLDEDIADYDLNINATEVVAGFALLAAGGYDGVGQTVNVAMMTDHPALVTTPQRRLDVEQWYQQNNIRYILNLAKTDTNMGKYPLDPLTLQHLPEANPNGGTNDFELPADDLHDQTVRILELPMQDKPSYDFRNCPHIQAAGRFIERAWRRHKKVLMGNTLGQLPGGEAVPRLTAPRIVIHCFGGINRSPLVLIYWLYRYHLNPRFLDSLRIPPIPPQFYYKEIVDRVVSKRNHIFKKDAEVVLKDKQHWIDDVKHMIDDERKQDAYKDLDHPFLRMKYDYEPCIRNVREQGVLDINCGGVPGSPFSDED